MSAGVRASRDATLALACGLALHSVINRRPLFGQIGPALWTGAVLSTDVCSNTEMWLIVSSHLDGDTNRGHTSFYKESSQPQSAFPGVFVFILQIRGLRLWELGRLSQVPPKPRC